jgi:serine/threonine-protein kinase HipA
MAEDATEVFVQIAGTDVCAGRLWSHQRHASESATFAYAEDYLARSDAYALDPALPLRTGQQRTRVGQELFGAFTDCTPNHWGRRLLDRAQLRESGARRRLAEIDYLLGVRDDMRQGALRFRAAGTDLFLAPEQSRIPPPVELPPLLDASARLECDQDTDDDVRLLLRGGSSLGGAHPKAHVIVADGEAAIAKFPSVTDDRDVGAWEAVTHELARRAGITVPAAALHRIDGRSVFIVERFDRTGPRRLGYASAMTMLEASEGERRSYLEIAEVIEAVSSHAIEDLRQLWTRIAFTILVSNTDDHLRNHGFLKTVTAGWELAPAFDVNPNPLAVPDDFATAINDESERTIRLLIDVADYFRLTPDDATAILDTVATATSQWQAVAQAFGLTKPEIDMMSPAFVHGQSIATAALRR